MKKTTRHHWKGKPHVILKHEDWPLALIESAETFEEVASKALEALQYIRQTEPYDYVIIDINHTGITVGIGTEPDEPDVVA